MPFEPRELGAAELPPALGRMARPPSRAWLWGSFPTSPSVAVVGTRSPSAAGLASTRRFVRELVEGGVIIVSGGAVGIDAAAHEAALEGGGKTFVFAPAWFTEPYPRQHRDLFERIVAGGGGYLCLSEPFRTTRHSDFHRRNEAMAAFAEALVVGQCGHKSGTKNAVKHARRLGRAVCVLPSAYGDPRGEGSNALIVEGAELVVSAAPLLKRLTTSESRRSLDPPRDPILLALWGGAKTPEQVAEESGQSPEVVQHRLLLLTLEGALTEDARGLLRYHPRR